ncbi:hypothetical protein [Deinococcus puniceus]|uniref:Spore coat protein U domain-containing protein n=1 Tax=Deinococcus puniceus TaxID=1182568 RepID=A0A172T9D3_9DEIO|nr:hypothetical protein [Deinococcus puniceus]ANE43611.1 hypothetical protein SU48_07330 [Deinococcus puniceus]
MFPKFFSLFMVLALSAPAQAGCEITRTALDLSSYVALQPQHGSFQVEIRCDAPTDRYQLELLGAGGQPDQPGGTVQIRLHGLNTPGQLLMLMQGAGTLLSGGVMEGSQRLRFPVSVPAGQWTGGGQYAANLRLSLLPAESPASLNPLTLPFGAKP